MNVRHVRGRPSAVHAIADLCGKGLVEIRSLARDRKVPPGDEESDINGPTETDFATRIYMIADVCHGFDGALGYASLFSRERKAMFALTWRWGASSPAAKRWIRTTLLDIDTSYQAILDILAKKEEQLSKLPLAPWASEMFETEHSSANDDEST